MKDSTNKHNLLTRIYNFFKDETNEDSTEVIKNAAAEEIKKVVIWKGKCHICGTSISSTDKVYDADSKVECINCYLGFSSESRQLKEDRRKIELFKQALREYEEERNKK